MKSTIAIVTIAVFVAVVSASDGDFDPVYVHTAYAGTYEQPAMMISWWTRKQTNDSTVLWSVNNDPFPQQTVSGGKNSQVTYNASVGYSHHVKLDNLPLDAKVLHFKCGSHSLNLFSEQFNVDVDARYRNGTRVAVYGDMGIAESQNTIRRLKDRAQRDSNGQSDVDWFLHVGDIGYGDDYPAKIYEAVWNQWFTEMEPITANYPYMVLPGNHEYSCKKEDLPSYEYTVNFTDYNSRFRMPFEESGGVNNMWYSFDTHMVHNVIIDTETDFPGAPEGEKMFADQLAWLEADLAKVDRQKTPWIIAAGHRPIYSSKTGFEKDGVPQGECADLQKAIEGLFYKYGVNIFFVGHVHSYERTHPTYNNKLDVEGTTHIVIGSAGNKEGVTKYDPFQKLPEWHAKRIGHWGYGIMTVVDHMNIKWEFYESFDNKKADDTWILNPHV